MFFAGALGRAGRDNLQVSPANRRQHYNDRPASEVFPVKFVRPGEASPVEPKRPIADSDIESNMILCKDLQVSAPPMAESAGYVIHPDPTSRKLPHQRIPSEINPWDSHLLD